MGVSVSCFVSGCLLHQPLLASTCIYVCVLYCCVLVCLCVCPSVRPSVCLSVRLSVRPSVRWSVCPSVRPFVCLPFCRFGCPLVSLSVLVLGLALRAGYLCGRSGHSRR